MDQITRYQVSCSQRYLLLVDANIENQVVLTNGSIVNATPTLNVDLYKALKGGLANFGNEPDDLANFPTEELILNAY